MRMKYVLKPLALSALAVGLLLVGTPAVQAAQNGDAPQGYKQKGDRDGRQDADRGGRHYDRKDSKNHPNGRMMCLRSVGESPSIKIPALP